MVHVLRVADVEPHGAGLVFAMSADEVVESVLSAADCDDFGAFLDEAVGHSSAYAGRGADHEDAGVLERHLCRGLSRAWVDSHQIREDVELDG